MSQTRYKIYETEYPYFITGSIVQGYPLISNPGVAKIILDGLRFLTEHRETLIYAYVLMENHIHAILQSEDLPKHMRAFKSWTAREIIDMLNADGHTLLLGRLRQAKKRSDVKSEHQVWKGGYYPKQIISDKMMIQKIEYIHDNPVKRGFVDRPEDWRYSSARNYLGMEGLLPVKLIER